MKPDFPRTLFLALGDMTWSACQASVSRGRAPAIAALMANGVRAPVIPSAVAHMPSLWPTVASGLSTEAHGIATTDEIWAGGLRPAGRASWRAPPFWERLEASGIATTGVGWPGIRPGADWQGIQVDDRLGDPSGGTWDDWYLPRGVCPAPLRDALREIRLHPTDVTGPMLQPFVPALESVDQRRDRRLIDIALAIARFSTLFGAFTTLLHRHRCPVATLHVDLLGRLIAFEGAAAPFDRVTEASWTLLDGAIGVVSGLTGDGNTLILFSPGRAGQPGVLAASGPGLPPNVELPPVAVLDIAPSLLARHGLRDPALPGAVRLNAPPSLRTATAIAPPSRDPLPDQGDLARVAAFGLRPPSPPPGAMAQHLVQRAQAMLATDPAAAAALARQALAIRPDWPAALGSLAAAHAAMADFEPLGDLADRLATIAPDHPWVPLIRGGYHAARGDAGRAAPLLREAERLGGPAEWIRIAAAWLMLRRRIEAARMFSRVLEAHPGSVDGLIGIGWTSGTNWIEAEQAFRRALAIDPANGPARAGLDRILRRTGRS